MMISYKTFFCSSYFLVLVVLGSLNINAQNTKQNGTFRVAFRYTIVSNIFDPKIDKSDEDRRFIEVFMDKKTFRKKNLINLFRLLSKQYPKPYLFYVDVFTNLKDITPLNKRKEVRLSETPGGEIVGDSAIFIRADNKSFFYMYFANGNFEEIEIK